MSTETKILALFEEGNPVPDVNGLDRVALDATSYLAALRAGSSNMTKVEDKIDRSEARRPRLVWLAAAAAALVVVIGGVALLQAGNDSAPPADTQPETTTPEMLTPGALPGNEFVVVDGRNQDLPQRLALADDGTFRVIDRATTIDHGSYAIDGDKISFVSEWSASNRPGDYGILWAYPSCTDCNWNVTMRTDKCEGVAGEYQLLFETAGRFSIEVVNDACLLRTFVANGLELVPDPNAGG